MKKLKKYKGLFPKRYKEHYFGTVETQHTWDEPTFEDVKADLKEVFHPAMFKNYSGEFNEKEIS